MLEPYVQRRILLGKDLVVLYAAVQEFLVAEAADGSLIGCGALHVMWEDLGEVRTVSWVTVDVGAGATSADIRVPADPDATEPPLRNRDEWRRLDGFTASTGAVQVKLESPVETRWVLVYLTSMPRDGANYVGAIHEIRVSP